MNYKECAYFSLYKQSPWIYKNYTFEISSSIRQQQISSRHPFAIHVVPRSQTNEHTHKHTHTQTHTNTHTHRHRHTKQKRCSRTWREEQLLQGDSEEDFVDDHEDGDEQQSHDTYANGFHIIMHK